MTDQDQTAADNQAPADNPAGAAPAGNAPAGGGDAYGRKLYDIKCSSCGKDAQVPFEPKGDRPVYCRDCYMQQKQR